MAASLDNRPYKRPVEYTAVEHDDDSIDDRSEGRPSEDAVDHEATDESSYANQQVSNTTESEYHRYQFCESGKTGDTIVPTITGWPEGPHQLDGVSIPFLIIDSLLILLPVTFLVLAATAWRLHGEPLSKTGQTVERAMTLGPTIYPLAFAAIGSRCLRSIAIRLAESGTTISTLEKLLGSQSVVSAVGTAFTLRSVNLTSVCLLLLWALSPLGGQSSLRLLHETNKTISETGTVYYSDPAAGFDLYESFGWFTLISAVLGASLAISEEVKDRPVDLWAHPKIPRIDLIEQTSRDNVDSEGEWICVNTTSNKTYSSWVGINVQGLLPDRHATFQVKSNYIVLDCAKIYGGNSSAVVEYLQDPEISIYPDLWPETPSEYSLDSLSPNDRLFNAKLMANEKSYFQMLPFFLKAAWNSTDGGASKDEWTPSTYQPPKPVRLLYGARYLNIDEGDRTYTQQSQGQTSSDGIQIHSCTQRIITVDAHVDCQAGDCEVTQLRNTPSAPNSECLGAQTSTLDCLKNGTNTLHMLLRFFPTVVGAGALSNEANPFDEYVAGSNVSYRTYPGEYKRNLSEISDKMISDRLTTLLNTYWQVGAWGKQVATSGLFDKPEYPWKGYGNAPERFLNTTEATFTQQIPVYEANIGWIICLLLITTILLLLSIANVVVSFLTIAPDLFYYASSLARENPYTNTPNGGTGLDGAKRSRLLKDMRVQVADVSPDSEIGYVVLKSVEVGEEFRTGRLRKGRAYW